MEDESTYDISVASATDDAAEWGIGAVRVIKAALRRHGTSRARISLALVLDDRMAELHERHLQKSGPTDVLSFDLRDGADGEPANELQIDGEIVVSVETARREAEDRGHAIESEVALYAVHGTLHLLGYDDQSEEEAARMHRLEDEILSAEGFGSVYFPSESS